MEEDKSEYIFQFEKGEGKYREIISQILPKGDISSPESFRLIKKAIKLDPNKPIAYLLAGVHYHANKDSVNTEKMFLKAVQVDPTAADLKRFIGVYYASFHESYEALGYLCDYILAGNWDDLKIVNLIADISEETNHPKIFNALKLAWQKTLDDKVGYIFGIYSRTHGQIDAALDAFELIAINKNFPEYWNQVGIIQKDAKKFDEAIEAYNKALEALDEIGSSGHDDPPGFIGIADSNEFFGILHLNLANAYLDKGSFEKALSEANIAIDSYKNIKSYEVKYNALVSLHRVEEAIAVAQETIASFELDTEGIIELYDSVINYFLSKGHLAEARKLITKGLAKYPDHLDFYTFSSWLHCKNKNYKAALNANNKPEQLTDEIVWQLSCATRRYAILQLAGQSDLARNIIKPGSEYDRLNQQMASQYNRSTSYGRLRTLMFLWNRWIIEGMVDEKTVESLKSIILDQFREEYPNDTELLLYEAYVHFRSSDYENVKRLLQIGLKNKNNPYKSLFENNLAVIYMLEGNLGGAKKLLKSHSKMEHIDEDLLPEFKRAFSHWVTIRSNGRYEPPISLFLPGVFEAGIASMVNLISLDPGEDEINETTSFVFSMLTALLDSDKEKSSIQLLRFFCYLLIGYIELTKGQLRKAYDSLNYSLEFAEKNSILDEEGVLTLRRWVENMNQQDPSK